MKITKYEHACLMVEDGNDKLVIDPGTYSKSFNDYQNVTAVVVTHVHQDHFDPDKLNKIIASNPSVEIYTTDNVAKEFNNPKTKAVTGGDKTNAGSMNLEFFGGQHAIIHSSYPVAQNVGVLVNDSLYYPGDSFSKPDEPVKVLAVPASAPWMKAGEAMDFVVAVKSQIVFPTHNALLSPEGQNLSNNLLGGVAKQAGVKYRYLDVGESFEV